MRIRPVMQSDAEEIGRINARVARGGILNFSNSVFNNADKLIEELTNLDHMLVLETETEPRAICAAVLLQVNPQIFLRRMATLRIIVDPEWQGQGLGKALMQSALSLADEELLMERVEVEIPTDNVNALKLCKSTGFKVEGTARDWLRAEDGRYLDVYLMAHCRNGR